ncbi:MAG: hypothetical protein MUQ75_04615, partial [Crocinitomicaceae bacterium]|nr:hypothetical protein [Crocinitomicaceae bacterium]
NLNSQFFVGLFIGIISPLFFLPIMLYLISVYDGYSFSILWNQFLENNIDSSKYLSLALIGNLIWFYLFLNKEKYYHTRGIIMGMLFYAPYMVYIYYFQ